MGADMTRRAALFVVAATVAYPLWKYFSPSSVGAQGVEVPLEDLPENGAYLLRDRKAAIIRRKNGIKAISIACTHLGCTLNVADDGFICPCHGSRFTLEGKVVKGPAAVDLRELRYELSGNTVKLYI